MGLRMTYRVVLHVAVVTTAGWVQEGRTQGNTYFVATTGSDGAAGTIGAPWQTISFAVARLRAGDTLYVRGGTYTGPANRIDSQDYMVASGTDLQTGAVTIAGYPGESATIVPPNNMACVRYATRTVAYVIVQDLHCDMSNSTVSGGSTESGVNVSYGAHHNRFLRLEVKHNSGNGIGFGTNGGSSDFNEVIDCEIHHNGLTSAVNSGYGLYIDTSDNLFEGNRIHHNVVYGVHIYNFKSSAHRNIVRNNWVWGNGTGGGTNYGILYSQGSNGLVYNNVVYGNRGGIQVYTNSDAIGVFNNTVVSNSPMPGIALQYYTGAPRVQNNIVYRNADGIRDFDGNAASQIDHNIMTDPSFQDFANGDFSLTSGSIARDTGVAVTNVTMDIARTPRPQGGLFDIGAYELGAASLTAPLNLRVIR